MLEALVNLQEACMYTAAAAYLDTANISFSYIKKLRGATRSCAMSGSLDWLAGKPINWSSLTNQQPMNVQPTGRLAGLQLAKRPVQLSQLNARDAGVYYQLIRPKGILFGR